MWRARKRASKLCIQWWRHHSQEGPAPGLAAACCKLDALSQHDVHIKTNQVLFEDSSVNRMHEALALFEEVVSNPIFADTPIFIFLNKKDLFEQMIKTDPLTIAFPEFAGPEGDVHAALDFITDKFRTALTKHAPRKNLHSHVVAARVRAEMKMAFGDVKDTVRDYQKLNGGGTKSNASSRMNSARN